MDLRFVPSLKGAALGKVIITLWNQEDIKAFIAKIEYEFPNELDIKVTIEKVIERIPLLSLPEPLEKRLICLAKPIGQEIITWKLHHEKFLPKEFVEASLNKLCWTQLGIVDRKSTAEVLIRNENTDITIRYKLACIYCLEHDIPVLWDKIPHHLRDDFYSENRPTDIKQEGLVVLWTYTVNGKLTKLIQAMESEYRFRYNPYKYTFRGTIQGGNIAAAEYLLSKMTPEERNDILLEYSFFAIRAHARSVPFPDICGTPDEHHSRILYFTLTQMTETQQMEEFEKNPFGMLRCFLDWPFHNIFMRVVKSVWAFVTEEIYYNLLCAVVRKEIGGFKDFNYRRLYGELWTHGQNSYIKYVVNRSLSACELFLNLILIDDESNILLILKDVSIQERENFVFSDIGKNVYKALVNGRRWEMFQLFSRECIKSTSIERRFRKEFSEHVFRGPEEMSLKMDIWNHFIISFRFN